MDVGRQPALADRRWPSGSSRWSRSRGPTSCATTRRQRLTSFLDADADIQGAGYQLHQAQIAVGSGGLVGKGLTNGTQAQGDFLPVQATDFVFAILAEELGFIGGDRAVRAVRRCCCGGSSWPAGVRATPFGTLFAAGVASMILFQLVVNVGMVLGHHADHRHPAAVRDPRRRLAREHGRSASGILQSINIRQTRRPAGEPPIAPRADPA